MRAVVQHRIAAALAAANGVVLASRLSRLECRVLPMRNNDSALLTIYESFFTRQGLEVRDIDSTVVEKATDVRANLKLKTPDAIQIATALTARVTLFLTGDKQLQRCSSLVPVEIVAP